MMLLFAGTALCQGALPVGGSQAPGARLHVLTIGVSDYGDRAKGLRLKFAVQDARDVASALVNTQDRGLYAENNNQDDKAIADYSRAIV